ncbi:potassium voltage-gated channel subfamily V member 1 isoform X2 [Betta splendens]|uniref:Potassium voltage-gated channel subfamily V member 1 isoform X2 n=1 Tax=Betta splendens TaxID=158456 RepID=A0A6P7KUX5_BETSP|nr:potassium voltage-gated channel subfamily V member 1 isoform X2 [Betta splendens]
MWSSDVERMLKISSSSPSSSSVAGEEQHSPSSSSVSLDSSVFFRETATSCVSDPLSLFVINVGGSRYVLSQELLASYPETRLGKLAFCGRDSALELCDDVDFMENEFFFDRSSQTFQYVMNYYRTGHLHVREELCEICFLQEIEYWGINELRINPCCRERYYHHKDQKETVDVQSEREFHADKGEEDFVGAACPSLRQRLWDLLEKPDSSLAARTFGSLSVFFVVVSVINMVLISLYLGEDFGGAAPLLLETLEYVCVVWFTGELALRFLCVRDKCQFSRSIPNVIDLLAILPFYVTLLVESLHGGSTELENMGRVVQVLRLLRSLRMLKLGRHSTGLKSLGLTIAQCYEEVGLLLLFLGVGISIFGALVFALERDVPATTFSSVPAAWWWATTSMTTVGYGDIRPDTVTGKVLAFLCILSGILILALPIAIINDRFSACYFTLKMKEAAVRHREVLKRLARSSVGGAGKLGAGVNLRDAYARSILEMVRLRGRERASTRSSGGEELWW